MHTKTNFYELVLRLLCDDGRTWDLDDGNMRIDDDVWYSIFGHLERRPVGSYKPDIPCIVIAEMAELRNPWIYGTSWAHRISYQRRTGEFDDVEPIRRLLKLMDNQN